MYSTCLFCNQQLGTNEVLEAFPVGRRIAFDPARGRLWVVCRKCERWNLSPLEERWEAIEQAERSFRDTRVRTSTEHIGLARHPSRFELVRIGAPLRPEFAAWRYGDQFGRRRERAVMMGGLVAAGMVGIAVAGAIGGVSVGIFIGQSGNIYNALVHGRATVKVPLEDGRVVKLRRPDALRAEVLVAPDGEWSLALRHGAMKMGKQKRVFTGSDAQRVAGLIMPAVNSTGARAGTVQEAVQGLEQSGGPDGFLAKLPALARERDRGVLGGGLKPARLGELPAPTRLALEMALHEETERRALEGELKELELAWRVAEEVAAISDDLLLPESVRERLERPR